jgi:hypothetical protein
MTTTKSQIVSLTLFIALALASASTVRGQVAIPSASSVDSAQVAERRAILESDRWRQARRGLNNWLATQRIYSADEVRMIKAEIDSKVSTMSASQLKDFMEDTEDRLAVLTGPDAQAAGQWVAQFLATARNAEEQLRGKRPDVLNMTAAQIQQELDRFHRQRGSRQQSQAAFDLGRSQQVQAAQSAQAAQRQSQAQLQASRSQAAANAQAQRQRPTSPADKPGYTNPNLVRPDVSPVYGISPWGTPIRWNAFRQPNY